MITDAASEAEEMEVVQTGATGEEEVETDSDSDDESDEGTYFIDQNGQYYYQATPDSEPVLTTPPKGKYVPEDDEGTGEDAGISYVLIVDEAQAKADSGPTKLSHNDKKENVYHIAEGDNIYIEEEEDIISEEVDVVEEGIDSVKVKTEDAPRRGPKKSSASFVVPEEVDGSYSCPHCTYVTTKKHLLWRHAKCHTEERPHKCDVCERGFKTVASLNNHLNTHTGHKPHRCKHCESAFSTSGELVRHVRYKHTMEKPHKCPDCDYASVELSKLRRHIRCHTGERPYQCPHCTYASPDTFKLKRHLRIHTGEKPYECDVCQARFTQSNSLKAHKLIHMGDKPVFKCEFCPTTCGRKTDLRIHVQKLHTPDATHVCRKCGDVFNDRYSLKQHLKTHEGEKCYKCEFCSYSAANPRHLESHILVHTNEKPFQCEFCSQTFRQKQLLKRHINLHHDKSYQPPAPKEKTQTCPTCGRGFHHKGNLVRHIATHEADTIKDADGFTLIDEESTEEVEEEEMEQEVEYEDQELEDGNAVEHEDEEGNRFVVLEVINNEDITIN